MSKYPTIIVSMKDLDCEKYSGCKSPFMFDEFNMIIYTLDGKKHHIEVRKNPHGLLYRINKDIWIGVRACQDITEIYPEKGIMTIVEYKDGDIGIGEFFVPMKILNDKEIKGIIDLLCTEKGYSHYKDCNALLGSILCTIMMMGKDRKKEQKKRSNVIHTSGSSANLEHKQKKIYLLDEIIDYISDEYIENKGHHNIQCPCWEVRGHYRHYKTGKEVFISSYKKGKCKETAQPIGNEYVCDTSMVKEGNAE